MSLLIVLSGVGFFSCFLLTLTRALAETKRANENGDIIYDLRRDLAAAIRKERGLSRAHFLAMEEMEETREADGGLLDQAVVQRDTLERELKETQKAYADLKGRIKALVDDSTEDEESEELPVKDEVNLLGPRIIINPTVAPAPGPPITPQFLHRYTDGPTWVGGPGSTTVEPQKIIHRWTNGTTTGQSF